jgi:hypothetical protein
MIDWAEFRHRALGPGVTHVRREPVGDALASLPTSVVAEIPLEADRATVLVHEFLDQFFECVDHLFFLFLDVIWVLIN